MPAGDSRMLWVTAGPVLPADDGNRQRLFHLLRASTSCHRVTLVTPAMAPADSELLTQAGITLELVDRSDSSGTSRLAAWRRCRPACLVSPDLDALIARVETPCRPWDLAFGPLAAAPAVFAANARRYGIDDQNHESHKYRLIQRYEPRPLRRLARLADWAEVRRYEHHWLAAADLVSVCSEADRRALLPLVRRGHVEVVPNGVDTRTIRPPGPPSGGGDLPLCPSAPVEAPLRVVYVGGMAYEPNVDACRVLASEVMPRIWDRLPEVTLDLVGKDPTPEVSALAGPQIRVTGRVDDPLVHIRGALATVVPLRSGGGTRLKILEAMAAGTPVIATPTAVAGLELTHGVEVLVGASSEALAEHLLSLASDPEQARALATAARLRVERDYDWSAIGRRFTALF